MAATKSFFYAIKLIIIINKMWYTYLNREQHYLRSYRTHNLWLDYYQKKIRTPRVTSFHLGVFKRLAKTYSGVSNGRALF